MLYREVGQYKTSYAADMAVFPILQDRIGIAVILFIGFVVVPLIGSDVTAPWSRSVSGWAPTESSALVANGWGMNAAATL